MGSPSLWSLVTHNHIFSIKSELKPSIKTFMKSLSVQLRSKLVKHSNDSIPFSAYCSWRRISLIFMCFPLILIPSRVCALLPIVDNDHQHVLSSFQTRNLVISSIGPEEISRKNNVDFSQVAREGMFELSKCMIRIVENSSSQLILELLWMVLDIGCMLECMDDDDDVRDDKVLFWTSSWASWRGSLLCSPN